MQSVNRKNLDVRLYCSSELRRFEIQIQKWAAKWVSRGQVTVKITFVYEKECPISVKPNLALARQIKQAAESLVDDLQLSDSHFVSRMLSRHDNLFLVGEDWEDESLYVDALKAAFDEAAAEFVKMKEVEGKYLADDIISRIQNLHRAIDQVEKECIGTVDQRKEKLAEVIGSAAEDEMLLREIGIYAEKVDVQEEITRFCSHLEQFTQTVASGGPVGKKLDFIIQELFREANTIASKSPEYAVKQLTIDIRSEIERIREQIQNIE